MLQKMSVVERGIEPELRRRCRRYAGSFTRICVTQTLLARRNLDMAGPSPRKIYAHLSIRQLKLVHENTHPAEQHPEGAAAKEGDAKDRAGLLSTLGVEGGGDE
jgi:hypothetical protein